jgi:hypothetical protein
LKIIEMSKQILEIFKQYSDSLFSITTALIGIILLLITSKQGLGLTPDSIAYFASAHQMSSGQGLTIPYGNPPGMPLTHYPPLLSLVLATWLKFGFDLTAFRWIYIILFIILFVIFDQAAKKIIPQYKWERRLLLIFFAVSHPTLLIFSMLWSEAWMIVFGFGGFWMLTLNRKMPIRPAVLTAGICFALASLTRYAGLPFLGAAILFFWLEAITPWKQKLIHSILVSTPTLIALGGWLLRNINLGASATNRNFSFHPIRFQNLNELVGTINSWFMLPLQSVFWARIIIFLLAVTVLFGSLVYLWKNRSLSSENRFGFLSVLFIFVYSAFIVFSLSFLDANIPLDTRILSPVFFSGFILLIYAIQMLHTQTTIKPEKMRIFLSGSLLLVVIIALFVSIPQCVTAYHNGTGFASKRWETSPAISFLQNLPSQSVLISNAPEPVYFKTGKPTYSFPKQYLAMEDQANSQFTTQIATLKNTLQDQNLVLIFFTSIPGGEEENILYYRQQFDANNCQTFTETSICTNFSLK